MIYPSIDDLLQKVDSKYTLVIAAAKRARQLRSGSKRTIKTDFKIFVFQRVKFYKFE